MVEVEGEWLVGRFRFDPEDNLYRVHFPGYPVVPGSVIIEAFVQAVRKHGYSAVILNLENFRFKTFIPPGDYHYRLQVLKKKIRCRLFAQNRVVATGELKR